MVNINDLWPEGPIPPADVTSWIDLGRRRELTFKGFAAIESQKGFVAVPASLSSPKGQEMIRLLMWRTMEELVESYDASGEDHYYEELIDAINYCWSICYLDPEMKLWEPSLIEALTSSTAMYWWSHSGTPFRIRLKDSPGELGYTVLLLGRACDTFRNRAWMERSQDVYFAGKKSLQATVHDVLVHLITMFPSWERFWSYFVAKDNVLQFRLRSNY